jgi:hypothetical protein
MAWRVSAPRSHEPAPRPADRIRSSIVLPSSLPFRSGVEASAGYLGNEAYALARVGRSDFGCAGNEVRGWRQPRLRHEHLRRQETLLRVPRSSKPRTATGTRAGRSPPPEGHPAPPPSSRTEVRERIGETQRERSSERLSSPRAAGYGSHPSTFNRLILPQIGEVAPATLAAATGLSKGYCASIRAGKRIPHPSHWAALQLAGLRARDGTQ